MTPNEQHVIAHYLVFRHDHPASTDLTPDHFRDPKLAKAWRKARSTKGVIDTLDILGPELTNALSDVITHASEMPDHIDALKSEWVRHKAREALAKASDLLRTSRTIEEIKSIVGDTGGLLDEAMAGGPHDSRTHSDLATDVAAQFVQDLQTEDRSIEVPWPGLQALVPGLPFGKVTLIGGRSSEHKTTLARLIMHHAIRHHGLTGTFWTGEDSAEDIARRCIASECSSLTLGRFSAGRWSPEQKRPTEDQLLSASAQFRAHANRDYWSRFRIEDRPFGTIDNVCAFIRQQHAKHGIRIFVGDFIQLIDGLNNKSDWVSAMAKLCGIAKALDLVMIWTSQVDKLGTKESTDANRPPRGIDMLFGTALKQQAYAVLMVGTDEGRLRVVVDKHKSARNGTECQLDIDAKHDRLGNYPEPQR